MFIPKVLGGGKAAQQLTTSEALADRDDDDDVLAICRRGSGDVRPAFLGGLGLGQVTHEGLLLGLAAVAGTTVVLAAVALTRGGNRKTLIPYGPALAAGFLAAVAV